jgi:hypothetical protein
MTDKLVAFEPNDYFQHLKSQMQETQLEKLETNRRVLSVEIDKANKLGQKNLLDKAAFVWSVLEKEMLLNSLGYTKYVEKSDVVRLIDDVKPKNSVKIIELENYPRSIPEKNAVEVERALGYGIFDKLLVLYTDFTDEEVHTPDQKEMVARNKDPIVFGMFYNEVMRAQHERLYFITDWEDEYCDLTFSKMIEKMHELGIEKPEKHTDITESTINDIIYRSKVSTPAKQMQFSDIEPVSKLSAFMSFLKRLPWTNNDT